MNKNNQNNSANHPKPEQSSYIPQNQTIPFYQYCFYPPQFPGQANSQFNWNMYHPNSYFMAPPIPSQSTIIEKESPNPEKKESPQEKSQPLKTKTFYCRCTKSHCRKEYCFCYKNGVSCNQKCICVNCKNTQDSLNIKHDFKKLSSVTCNCSKSKCQKKYCECFAAGRKCGDHCNCQECKNC